MLNGGAQSEFVFGKATGKPLAGTEKPKAKHNGNLTLEIHTNKVTEKLVRGVYSFSSPIVSMPIFNHNYLFIFENPIKGYKSKAGIRKAIVAANCQCIKTNGGCQ